MRTHIILVTAAALALPPTAQSASFDCGKASSEAERIICSDDIMSRADDLLSDAFAKALYASKQPRKLTADQASWLRKKRDACRDISCLRAEYASRTAELEALALRATPTPELTRFRHLNRFGGAFPWVS